MFDCQFFGLEAGSHHAMSVLFHILGSWLLFFALASLSGDIWKSAFVAGLFAVHPLHVESVAWVSERKDVLSGFFFGALLWSYAWAVRSPTGIKKTLVSALLLLGLLAKPMLVTAPFVLLLLDVWPLKRLKTRREFFKRVKEKAFLFLLSAGAAVLAVSTQQSGNAIRSLSHSDLTSRIVNALSGYGHYLLKTFWPSNLAAYYPLSDTLSWPSAIFAACVILIISVLSVRLHKKHPYLLVGWLWFLGMLVPVIGLVQVGSQAYADRYSYLPSIGLFVMVAWGIPSLFRDNYKTRVSLGAAAAVVLIALTAAAHMQTRVWRDSVTLFTRVLEVNRGHVSSRMMLADALNHEKRPQEAERLARDILEKHPHYPWANYVMARSLVDLGRAAEGVSYGVYAAKSMPAFVHAHATLCEALTGAGRPGEAISACQSALRIDPEYASAYAAWGDALVRLGEREDARKRYQEAIRLSPFSQKYLEALKAIN
jgi:tetratricopeptide (TPR) repeat protein